MSTEKFSSGILVLTTVPGFTETVTDRQLARAVALSAAHDAGS
ncbi:MAG: hypothetical protein ACKO65_00575 [Betaproteobacteria bacterium]